jgi:hypothetical protein
MPVVASFLFFLALFVAIGVYSATRAKKTIHWDSVGTRSPAEALARG